MKFRGGSWGRFVLLLLAIPRVPVNPLPLEVAINPVTPI